MPVVQHGRLVSFVAVSGDAMTCFSPIDVPKKGYVDLRVKVACGRCLGCRIERRDQWMQRLLHESKLHLYKWFATLTYSDDKLPRHGSLVKRHVQLWQKRVRKARPGDKVRFFSVGEYGKTTRRAHYHSLVFGTDFPDKRKHSEKDGNVLYCSEEFDRLWGHGHCSLGSVTPESCAYVAGYVVDKINGQMAEAHYSRLDAVTGEVVRIEPEFAVMSLKPGIGAGWYERYKDDFFPSDVSVVRGKPRPVPDYYTDKLKADNPQMHDDIKARRLAQAQKRRADSTPARLAVRQEVAAARLALRSGKI